MKPTLRPTESEAHSAVPGVSFPYYRAPFRLSFDPGPIQRHERITPEKLAEQMELRVSEYAQESANLNETIQGIERELEAANDTAKEKEIAESRERLEAAQQFLESFQGKAAFWRKFIDEPESIKAALSNKFFGSLQLMFEISRVDAEVAIKLGEIVNIIVSHLFKLGSRQAAKELASIAAFATERANELASQKPGYFRPIAKLQWEWPLMSTRRKSDQLYEETFLASIGLAEAAAFKSFNTSKWTIWDEAGRVAWELWRYVFSQRQRVNLLLADQKRTARLAFSALEMKAAKLKDFSEKSYSTWWEVAEEFLLESYPKPLEHALLKRIGAYKHPDRRKTSGTRRLDDPERLFFEALRSKFKSFAGANRRSRQKST